MSDESEHIGTAKIKMSVKVKTDCWSDGYATSSHAKESWISVADASHFGWCMAHKALDAAEDAVPSHDICHHRERIQGMIDAARSWADDREEVLAVEGK